MRFTEVSCEIVRIIGIVQPCNAVHRGKLPDYPIGYPVSTAGTFSTRKRLLNMNDGKRRTSESN
jgi:hypothetical protein